MKVILLLLTAGFIFCLLMLGRTGEIDDKEFEDDEDYAERQDKKWPD